MFVKIFYVYLFSQKAEVESGHNVSTALETQIEAWKTLGERTKITGGADGQKNWRWSMEVRTKQNEPTLRHLKHTPAPWRQIQNARCL